MVLQREKPITIWGMCDPGEEITVVFSSQVKKTRVANDSTWEVEFPKQEASFEPRKISISSENDTITLVWETAFAYDNDDYRQQRRDSLKYIVNVIE